MVTRGRGVLDTPPGAGYDGGVGQCSAARDDQGYFPAAFATRSILRASGAQ